MLKTHFYPLRTIIGASVPVRSILPFPTNERSLKIARRKHDRLANAVEDEVYVCFLPDIIKGGTTYLPFAGMDTMSVPDSHMLPGSKPS